jgi:hypothetical protein
MCTVAPGNIGSVAHLRDPIRAFQTRAHTTNGILEAQQLRLALDLDPGLGQPID